MDVLVDFIVQQFENPISFDTQIRLIDESTKTEIGSFYLHKLLLFRCDYFSKRLVTCRSDSPCVWQFEDKGHIDVTIPDILWITKEAARAFFKMFYTCNSSEISTFGISKCLQVHRLADFFVHKDIKFACEDIISRKMGNSVDIVKLYLDSYVISSTLDVACKQWTFLTYIQSQTEEAQLSVMFTLEMDKSSTVKGIEKNLGILNTRWKVGVRPDDAVLFIIQETQNLQCIFFVEAVVSVVNRTRTRVEYKEFETPHNGTRLDLMEINIDDPFEKKNIYLIGISITFKIKHVVYPLAMHYFPQPHEK